MKQDWEGFERTSFLSECHAAIIRLLLCHAAIPSCLLYLKQNPHGSSVQFEAGRIGMLHAFQWLSGMQCTNAQEVDVDATACASDIARAAFPHLRIAMLMLIPLGSTSSKDVGSSAECEPCEPSCVFPEPTTFAVVDVSAYTLESCAKQGLVLAGKWVFAATGREWTNDVMCAAAKGGHLEFAQWALAEGCPWGCIVMYLAARGGQLEFAKWARASGCLWGTSVMSAAAGGGHLEFAKWAKAEGCKWTDYVMWFAARGGHLEFAQWAHATGCDFGNGVVRAAAQGGHFEFAKWAKAKGCPS